jgi:transcription elongation factor Elf1
MVKPMNKDRSHNDKCLPCPVCGAGKEHLYLDEFKGRLQVVCDGCQTSVSSRITPQEAIDRWNLLMQHENDFNKDAIKLRKEYKKRIWNA